MAFWNKKNKDGGKPEKKESLADKFRRAAGQLRGLRLKDLGPMTRHSLSDLKQPKEAAGLAIAIIVPGGMFGWFAYRIDKYRRRIANDNTAPRTPPGPPQNQPAEKPAAKKPKKPKPPAA